MEVLKPSAYLLRLKRAQHNDRLLVLLSLIDVRTNAELTIRALSVPAALRLLAQRFAADDAFFERNTARMPALPRRRNRRGKLCVRSRIHAGNFLSSFDRFGRTLAPTTQHPTERRPG